MNWPILSVVTFLPVLGALLVMLLARGNGPIAKGTARWIALWTTLVTFAISLVMVWRFDATSPEFQFVEKHPWLGLASYHMGVDGISLPFVILTTALMPICILASWTSIQKRVKEYMVAFLILETLMVGTFSALDLVLFYLFFEGGLIPMFLIIGVWGGPRRVYASFKFFLYTLLGSVLMLLAIMAMYWDAGTTDIPALLRHGFPLAMQKWAWLAFFASFAVKLPMWPVHTWLPDAHVEAPTAGSVILAAILLKMGGYGFLRFSLPMFPVASHDFAPLIFTLSVVAIIYTSLVALMQEDVKKLIAYSSVAHMGFVTMGIFALTAQGIAGGIFQMISHGIVSGALFLCVGVVYDRMHTREIAFYGGLVNRMPVFAFVFMVFTLANVGLPGTSGFVGEFLSLIGTFKANNAVATFATLGVILSAAYALWLYRKMIFGTLKPALVGIKDMGWREILIFTPLVALTILFGVAPKPVLDMSAASVVQLLDNYKHALAAANVPAKDARRRLCLHHHGAGRDDPSERRPMNQFMQMQGLMPIAAGSRAGDRRHGDADGRRDRVPERAQRADRERLLHRVLALAAFAVVMMPPGRYRIVRRQPGGRRLCALPQAAGARRLRRRADAVDQLAHRREPAEIRIRRAVPAVDARHDAADFRQRPDRALSRARDDEPAALRGGRLEPRQRAARPKPD